MIGLYRVLVVAMLASGGGQLPKADALDTVRQFYAAADYEAALGALEQLSSRDAPADVIEIGRYRALCLIAIGRTADAETVIEQVLGIDPSYQPDEQEPPRVRAAYASVRARVLPQVTRASYTDAKAAYDRREYEAAAAGFVRTIALLDALESADPALGDLRTLASGFLDLSRTATKAAAVARPEPVATPAIETPAKETPVPQTRAPGRETPITPPVVLQQELPPWNPASFGSQFQSEFRGAIEVTIDERGMVIWAQIVEPVHPAYDPQLLQAASGWRYGPARRGEQPVVSVKRVDIVLRPR